MGVEAGIDGVEVADLGALRVIHGAFPDLSVTISNYVNLFNSSSAAVLQKFNARRIVPYVELALDEIDEIRTGAPIDIEIPVHGKIPLGYTEICVNRPEQHKTGKKCPATCYDGQILRSQNGLGMAAFGRATYSHKDLCMIDHLGSLVEKGYRHFRIEGRFESGDYRRRIGTVYRNHLETLMTAKAEFRNLNADGLCNGFYFSRPGMDYVY
jgi:putative protease